MKTLGLYGLYMLYKALWFARFSIYLIYCYLRYYVFTRLRERLHA
ncbi:hypothetical protein [Spirosoma sp. KNUC1025]